MQVLAIDDIPAPYSFERDGGDEDRSAETSSLVSVSTVKSYIASKTFKSNYDPDFGSAGMAMKAWLGIAMERQLVKDIARTEPDHIAHPGEWISEPCPSTGARIMAHPDGFYFESGGLRYGELGIDEYKHTYTSSRHYDNENALYEQDGGLCWHYLFQAKSYAAVLRSVGVDCREARLWVLNVAGDYGKQREPKLTRVRVSWDTGDLERHLRLLLHEAPKAFEVKETANQ